MTEELIYKQEFNVRNLLTRSVTLYPTKAQIVRDINEISLQPGANEITIYGLTPTADESSIKVDGRGSATITDMMVELAPNKEIYEDVYPSDTEAEDADDSDHDASESDTESDLIKSLKEEANQNEDSMKQAREMRASAASRLSLLESYGRSFTNDRPNDLKVCMRSYHQERQKTFEDHVISETQIRDLEFERAKIMKKQAKAALAASKETEKARKEITKVWEKKRRARQEKQDAKQRIKDERIHFWPRKVYCVVLNLDTNSDLTPASSRHGSIDSIAKPLPETSSGSCQISLSLSYITSAAFWLPRYDLSLNTPTHSGIIVYRAEFCNTTSETWKDAKVVLSTSQTSFHGLGEPIPSLLPWHIRLVKGFGHQLDNTSGAVVSTYEMEHKRKGQVGMLNKSSEPRHVLFGLGSVNPPLSIFSKPSVTSMRYQPYVPCNSNNVQGIMQAPRYAPMPAPMQGSNVFGAPSRTNEKAAPGGSLFGQSSLQRGDFMRDRGTVLESENDEYLGGNADTIIPDLPELATQESTWSESGLTATYDIPGLRTIAPSNTRRRQKIASIILMDIQLSYVMVPKLRAAAFLKARFRNTSSFALLKGPAGLTLDGSFLGNTNVPRCSAGESFSLSLGVDPSVNVTYSKPVVKRSQVGVFQKEGTGVYTRTCTITNTKSNRALEGTVLDQIPVSEDDRLKIEIIQPSGLRNEGDVAKGGTPIALVGKTTEKWGQATAMLKKGGEICWDVKIEPSRGVKLVLEYEARFPSTEIVVDARA